ncbi:MAG: hypothetical protein JST43_04460 [Bacteroidetes bacterium]|nr:hypothetical protein [Bacteroidota bacterium]MBS1539925.1 hypothetical protein [Bacteroidota bacterium]
MKIKKSSVILLLLTLYGANYFFFERVLFFNELLSLIGFYFFLTYSFTKQGRFILPRNTIYRCVLAFILLGLIYAFVSLFLKTNWYYYFRNFSIVYSAFSFFIGYHLYTQQYYFFKKIRNKIYAYAGIALALRWPFLIDRNSYSFLLAIVQRSWKLFPLIMLMVGLGLYLLAYTSATVAMIMAAIAAMVFIRKYAYFKLLVVSLALSFIILFSLASPYLKLYATNRTLFFGDVEYVYSQHPLFQLDYNTSWRMILWYRTVVENFPQNLLGIGIGTPLLPYTEGATTQDTGNGTTDEYWSHVSGLHNTFITLFVRFGVLFPLIMLLIYRQVFREFYLYRSYYVKHRNDFSLFIGFVVISMVGLFNLLLDSPTLASVYWASLGFVARAIYERKYDM